MRTCFSPLPFLSLLFSTPVWCDLRQTAYEETVAPPAPSILPLPWPYYKLSVYYKTLGKQRDTCSYCSIDRER